MTASLTAAAAPRQEDVPSLAEMPAAARPPTPPPSLLCELLVQQQKRIAALQEALLLTTEDLVTVDESGGEEDRKGVEPTRLASRTAPMQIVELLDAHASRLHSVWERCARVSGASLDTAAVAQLKEKDNALCRRHLRSRGGERVLGRPPLTSSHPPGQQIHPVIMLDVTPLLSCRSQQPAPTQDASPHGRTQEGVGSSHSGENDPTEALEAARARLSRLEADAAALRLRVQEQQTALTALAAEKAMTEKRCAEAMRTVEDHWAEVEAQQRKLTRERAEKDRELERLRILMRFSELKKDSDLLPNVAHRLDEMERESCLLRERLSRMACCLEAVAAAAVNVAASTTTDPASLRALQYISCLCQDANDGDPSAHLKKAVGAAAAAAPVSSDGPRLSLPKPFATVTRTQAAPPPPHPPTTASEGLLTDANADEERDVTFDTLLGPHAVSRVRRALMAARSASAATDAAVARRSRSIASEALLKQDRGRPPRSGSSTSGRLAARQRPSSSSSPSLYRPGSGCAAMASAMGRDPSAFSV